MSDKTTTCDWSGHDDGEMYTTETCEAVYDPKLSKGWLITRKKRYYCPEHAEYTCEICEEPNMDTMRCPDIKTECINCCGDPDH